MIHAVVLRRLGTGVPGFDSIPGGRLAEHFFKLIAEPAGSGETTLVRQILFAFLDSDRIG